MTPLYGTAVGSYAVAHQLFDDHRFFTVVLECLVCTDNRMKVDNRGKSNKQWVIPEKDCSIRRILINSHARPGAGHVRYESWDPDLEILLPGTRPPPIVTTFGPKHRPMQANEPPKATAPKPSGHPKDPPPHRCPLCGSRRFSMEEDGYRCPEEGCAAVGSSAHIAVWQGIRPHQELPRLRVVHRRIPSVRSLQ